MLQFFNIFTCLVESQPVKQEVSTVILPLTKKVSEHYLNLEWCVFTTYKSEISYYENLSRIADSHLF